MKAILHEAVGTFVIIRHEFSSKQAESCLWSSR